MLDNTYARIVRAYDATDTERLQRILRECFHHQAMAVIVEDPPPSANTPAQAFVHTLRGWSCLHFIEE